MTAGQGITAQQVGQQAGVPPIDPGNINPDQMAHVVQASLASSGIALANVVTLVARRVHGRIATSRVEVIYAHCTHH